MNVNIYLNVYLIFRFQNTFYFKTSYIHSSSAACPDKCAYCEKVDGELVCENCTHGHELEDGICERRCMRLFLIILRNVLNIYLYISIITKLCSYMQNTQL